MNAQQIRGIWQEIYCSKETYENSHKEFAMRIGMDYQEAKQRCYQEFYSTPFIRQAFIEVN